MWFSRDLADSEAMGDKAALATPADPVDLEGLEDSAVTE
jgi:hypothetical protein